MKKIRFKKRYVFAISVLFGLIIATLFGSLEPRCVAAFKNEYPSEVDYNILKDYASAYVKTLDSSFIKDDKISVSHTFKEDSIIVNIEEYHRCTIKAEYPLKTEITKDGTFVRTIVFEEAKYEEIPYANSSFHNTMFLLIVFLCSTALFYILIKEIHDDLYLKIKESKNSKI